MPYLMQGKGLRLPWLRTMVGRPTGVLSTPPLFNINNRLSLSSKPFTLRENLGCMFTSAVSSKVKPNNNSRQKDNALVERKHHPLVDDKLQAAKVETAELKATEEKLLASALSFPSHDPSERSRVVNNFARAYEIETWFKEKIKAAKAAYQPLVVQALEKAYAEFKNPRTEAFKQLQKNQEQEVTKVTAEFMDFYHHDDSVKIFKGVWNKYLKNNQQEKLDQVLTQIMNKAAESARGADLFSSIFLTVYKRGLLHRIERLSSPVGSSTVTFATTATPLDASGVNVPMLASAEGRVIHASKDVDTKNTVPVEVVVARAGPILSFAEDNWRIYQLKSAANLDLKDPKYNYSYVYVEQPTAKLSFIEDGVEKSVTLINIKRFRHALDSAYLKEDYKLISTFALKDAITHNSEEKHVPQCGQDVLFVSNFTTAGLSKNENLKNKLILVKNNDDYQLYYVGAQGKAEIIPLKDKVGFKNKLDAKDIKLDGESVHLTPAELQNHIDFTKYRLVTVLSAADDKTQVLELRFPANDTVRTDGKTANAMQDSGTLTTEAARQSAMLLDTYQQAVLRNNLKEMRSNLAAEDTVIALPASPQN